MAEAALRNELASAKLTRALDIQQVEQLIDLLHVRRGVEREAAVLAASRATPEDLADLRANVEQYDNAVAEHGVDSNLGNDFHRLIIKAAHSPLLETLSNLTLNERIDALEPVLFVITKGHGTIGSDPKEHLAILDALERGDVQEADRVQTEHLTRLITEVEEFARTNDAELFQRILQLAR
ncbi:FadR/GntR family transcriptional regulator [Gulosibacter sp. ACHW.36C]|uniref:FCD domain-containing protein n=1 Tax=Gulosibacter sediminis TaxID=1729695 RepID=A0ABY4MW52_9MICO|nr:FCD domain-containing protein [Gulosibacter sediminis]UQN14656.1 FCD domain-containing protein [Gulosibacter sediminis]